MLNWAKAKSASTVEIFRHDFAETFRQQDNVAGSSKRRRLSSRATKYDVKKGGGNNSPAILQQDVRKDNTDNIQATRKREADASWLVVSPLLTEF